MTTTAATRGYLLCDGCFRLNHVPPEVRLPACARCGNALHARKPDSIKRSWAYLAAAAILYLPANTLPVMESGGLFMSMSDTIWSGIVYLWETNSPVLAAIVFTASMVIPAAKIMSMTWLLATAGTRCARSRPWSSPICGGSRTPAGASRAGRRAPRLIARITVPGH